MTAPAHTEPAPVALFAYNRPDLLRRTIHALAANELAEKTTLIVWSDGAKDPKKDGPKVEAVRRILDGIRGFAHVERHDSPVNRGLAESIISGVTDVISRYGKVIVLEDDLMPAPGFLKFMNDALNKYENVEKVSSVHAHFPGDPQGLPDTFFLRGANCWGWATWARGWALFQRDGRLLLKMVRRSGERKRFDYNGSFTYYAMLKGLVHGDTESWAIRWYAATFLAKTLTLNSKHSLVFHTGFDSGVHFSGGKQAGPGTEKTLWREPVPVDDIPVEECPAANDAMERYYRQVTYLPPLKRCFEAVRGFLRNLTPRPILKVFRTLKKKIRNGRRS